MKSLFESIISSTNTGKIHYIKENLTNIMCNAATMYYEQTLKGSYTPSNKVVKEVQKILPILNIDKNCSVMIQKTYSVSSSKEKIGMISINVHDGDNNFYIFSIELCSLNKGIKYFSLRMYNTKENECTRYIEKFINSLSKTDYSELPGQKSTTYIFNFLT